MPRMSLRTICTTLASAALCFCTAPAVADYTKVTFTATIGGVETDTGGGTFSGVGVGATVTGEFRYGTSGAEATYMYVDPAGYDTEYYFDGTNHGASFTSGTTSSGGDAVWMDIEDNFPADAVETVPILNEIFGLNVSVGDPLDVWSLDTESPGTVWDDDLDCLVNGLEFELVLLDDDGTMFNDQSFRAQPPAQGDTEVRAIFIDEAVGSTGCNTVYSAYGTITDIQYELVTDPVPQPVGDYSKVTFTATVEGVETDTGSGIFSGVGAGATVTGEFRYGTSDAEATDISYEIYDTEYLFTGGDYGASLVSGASSFGSDNAWLFIENNSPISTEDAAFINQAFGLSISPGTSIDVWGLLSESPNNIWDDQNDCLVNGLEFEIVLADADGTMYDDMSFRAQPPAPGDIELAAFFIEEASGTTGCNTTYAAYGTITDIQYELAVAPEAKSKAMPWLNLLLEE